MKNLSKEIYINHLGQLCRTFKTGGHRPRGIYTMVNIQPVAANKYVRLNNLKP